MGARIRPQRPGSVPAVAGDVAKRAFAHHHRPVCAHPRQRGFTLVEAAFVFPVFMLLLLGVVEFGLFMNDYLAVSSAVRAGSRAASASGNDGKADLYTILKVAQESTALNRGDIKYVVIYKPTKFGEKPSDTCAAGSSVTGLCNVYTYGDMQAARAQVAEETRHAQAIADGNAGDVLNLNKIWFGCLTTGPHSGASPDRFWCPTTRDVSLYGVQQGTDYVGVYMKATHRWVTRMFGTTKDIFDRSVIRLEPRTKNDDV